MSKARCQRNFSQTKNSAGFAVRVAELNASLCLVTKARD